MKTYLRILSYLRNHLPFLIASLMCITLFTILSSITLISVMPFLQVIFYTNVNTVKFEQPARVDFEVEQIPTVVGSLAGKQQNLKQKFMHFFIGSNPRKALLRICLIIIVLFLLKGIAGYLQVYFMARVEQNLIMDIRNEVYHRLSQQSLGFFNQMRAGHLISRITNDVNLINNGISASFVTLIKNPLLIIAYLIIAFYLSWQLTVAALVVLPVSMAMIGAIGIRLRKDSALSQDRMGEIATVVQETIAGIRVIKAFNMEPFEIAKFKARTKAYFQSLLLLIRKRALASPLTEFLGALVGVGIIWFGGQQVLHGQNLRPDEFITFLFVIFAMMNPVRELSTVNNRIQEAVAAGERVFRLMDRVSEIKNPPHPVKLKEFKEKIEFKNVYFKYEADRPWALQNVNLQIHRGEILAIVGPSGAGKSTLVDLIPRFYDPTFGSIFIDGVNLRDLDLTSLRELLGIVTQETILFNDTVFNNIAYGRTDVTLKEVQKAAIVANAHGFISELPQGYDTYVGDRGLKLSGGQRQRLAIARAVLKNPPILILDEATSSLDSESEFLVQQALERLMHNRTVFVIAHRLSTVLYAHRVIVMERGQIVQQGTHEQLIQQDGIYQKLYRMQFRA